MKQFRNMAYPYIVWSVIMIILPMPDDCDVCLYAKGKRCFNLSGNAG